MNKEDKQFFKAELTALRIGLEDQIGTLKKQVEINTLEIRHTGVILEQMDTKIDLIAENTMGLNRRITVLEERVGV